MATIPAATQLSPISGDITTPATAAASAMTFANNGRVLLAISSGATPATLTITTPKVVPVVPGVSLTVQDPTVSIAATSNYLLGPFDTSIFNDANGEVAIAFSATTSIVVQAYTMPLVG